MRAPAPPVADPKEIARALRVLLEPGQVTELRALDVRFFGPRGAPREVLGYFDDAAALVQAAMDLDAQGARGIYCTPNPLVRDLLARRANRVDVAGKDDGTKDHEVAARRWLLVDADPARPAKISATEEEHALALQRATEIRSGLRELGWPDPVVASSGNGAHLLYRVDLPGDDGGLCARVTQALGLLFSDAAVAVDLKVFNAARIWRLYGTVARKGDHVPERPWRRSELLEVPGDLRPVPRELLDDLAAQVPQDTKSPGAPSGGGRGAPGDSEGWLDDWLREHGGRLGEMRGPKAWSGGGRKWVLHVCPWDAQHKDRSAWIGQRAGGEIAAGCQHRSCAGRDWHALRDLVEPGWRDKRDRARYTQRPPQAPRVHPDTGEPLYDAPPSGSQPPDSPPAGPPPPPPAGEPPSGASGPPPPTTPDERPRVLLSGDLEESADLLWTALLRDAETAEVYRMPSGLVRVHRDIGARGDRLLVETFTPASWRAYVGRRVLCEQEDQKTGLLRPASPSKDLAEYQLLRVPPGVRVLRDVYRAPTWLGHPPRFFARGYHAASTALVDPGPLALPAPPADPSDADVAGAIGLWREVLSGFPFQAEADFAHVLALALTLVLRPQIDGPCPLFFVAAPWPRSGKTLLLKTLHAVATGEDLRVRAPVHDDEEWNKLITTTLVSQPALVCIDNVARTLASASLASVLTSTVWSARRLGTNDDGGVEVSARAVWTATGNQPRFSDELAERTLLIRLVPMVEDPSTRSDFTNELPDDAYRDRPELLHALHVLVARWVAVGRPQALDVRLGGFERWVRVVGGVLRACGVPGLLENRSATRARASGDVVEWRTLVETWIELHGVHQSLTTSEVLELADQADLFQVRLGDGSAKSRATRMGKALLAVDGMVVAGHLVKAGERVGKTKAQTWRLEVVAERGGTLAERGDVQRSAHATAGDESGNAGAAERAERAPVPQHAHAHTRVHDARAAAHAHTPAREKGGGERSARSAEPPKSTKLQAESRRNVAGTHVPPTFRHVPPRAAGYTQDPEEEGEL